MAQLLNTNALLRCALRAPVPTLVLVICLWALAARLEPGTSSAVWAYVVQVTPLVWLQALGLSIASLWAVGRYDGVGHRHLQTGVRDRPARLAGTVSIALAQTLGMGVLTGALARWRLLPDLTLAQAFRLSAFVSVSFLGGWAVVTAMACLLLPSPGWTLWPAIAVLTLAAVASVLQFLFPVLRLWGKTVHLPTLPASAAIMLWTLIDTLCAAGALYVVLPADAGVTVAQFLPLFLLALGSALISNTPGGVGPFELMMLGLLPHLPASDVLGSIVAFRIVYYALPALLAAAAMMRPLRNTQANLPAPAAFDPRTAYRAEVGVMRQNGAQAFVCGASTLVAWKTGQTLTGLCDPQAGCTPHTLSALQHLARSQSRIPLWYKCSARTAAQARKAGWAVMHIADDAVISTADFDTDRPLYRRLRRKLRTAQKAGVVVTQTSLLPIAEMTRIDAEWQSSHGRARGGTMGQFEVRYVTDQRCMLAHLNGRLVAFATFHAGAHEWCLDLVRHGDDLPDGSMFALVDAAISTARAEGVGRVNLAAIPACADPGNRFWRWLGAQMVTFGGGAGLRQFKSGFAPQWQPRYAAAPNWTALTLALADIARAVHHPAPLTSYPSARPLHEQDENYELASRRAS
ncbi:phosphatidylglycerol lysyltransferase domain-containing protein [Pseudosulfitobacter koreensis]|uniref:Phosphatidylglycerol lysyltransferase domain-containing protein n=1 Tax=Pseudosulfitobacter koreensis TaxID=2968472 RepID=A0ABT1Z0H8_9RHOB|nr:phosphatidylglycerol lysyltransferase domain-containing protein [Pseudosulfitobacter koreense]MCR8826653.1 phosphatidylglycerol lysyltransferase domain-containing protein [Pseudosulfitobacter koreense]